MFRKTTALCVAVIAVLAMVGSANADVVIYEPFDYEVAPDPAVTGLVNQNGGTGWADGWKANWSNASVKDDGVDWGVLPTTGGRCPATGHAAIYRSIDSSVASAGLLNDGVTVWFSVLADIRGQGNITNLEFNFSLGTDSFLGGWGTDSNGNSRYARMNHLLNDGEGIGVGQASVNRNIEGTWTRHAQFRTAYWQDNGEDDNDAGDAPDSYGNLHLSEQNEWFGITQEVAMLVGKIEWGVGDAGETVTLYIPGMDYDTEGLGEAIQTVTAPDLNQAAFDTVAMMWKDTPGMDEIRFGATMEDVLGMAGDPIGDADGDGDVDAADYIMIKTHFGSTPGAEGPGGDIADGSGNPGSNGVVDWYDLQLFQDNYTTRMKRPTRSPNPRPSLSCWPQAFLLC